MKQIFLITFLFLITFITPAKAVNSSGNGEWASVVQSSYNIMGAAIVNIGPNHVVHADQQITILWGGNLNIISDSLIINAGLVSNIGGNLYVGSGAVLYIDGDLDNNLWGNIEVDGELKVTGDVSNIGSEIKVNPGGSIDVDGDFSNIGNVINKGKISVGGKWTGIKPDPDDGGELPIELIYFNAQKNGINISLNWQTASEENNDYFTLERSVDGMNYEVIGSVLGAGNSNTELNYSYTDNSPVNGVSYYRLTQTDYNGDYEVFSPVSVSFLNDTDVKVGPIPAIDEFNVSMTGFVGPRTIELYNITGTKVKSIETGNSYTTINVSDLPSGYYMMVISANESKITKKVIIQ